MAVKRRRAMARPMQPPPVKRKPPNWRVVVPIAVLLVLGFVAVWAFLPRNPGPGPGTSATPRVVVSGASVSARPSPVATRTPDASRPPASAPATPTPIGPDTSAPPSAPVSTLAPVVPGAGLPIEWQPAPAPGLGIVLGVSDSASAADRVVIIGDATEEFIPRIWASTDGSTWSQAAFPDESNAIQLTAVAPGGPGFIAFASDFDTAAAVAYVSADGLNWQRVDDSDFADESIYSVGTAGGTTVAIGDSGSVYYSTDGVSWMLNEDPSSFAVGDGVLDLISYNGSIWAFGQDTATPDEEQPVDVWRTDDGLTWTALGTIPGSEGALELWASAGPKGLVAMADVDQGARRWTAWHSPDGVNWQQASNSPSTVVDLIATDVGFVAAAYYNLEGGCVADEMQNVGLTWTSVDGLIWRQIPETNEWVARQILALGQIGRRLVGVGVDFNALYSDPVVDSGLAWTVELPAEATDTAPPPPQQPEPTLPPDCGAE